MPDSCDVLVIGGGPAGSTCAWKLRQAGLDVMVLDKRTFPRDKTCAGWITPAVVAELDLDTQDYARSRVFQPITGFRTGVIGGRAVHTSYRGPVSFGIRRCEFDHYLLQRSGARLRLGAKFDSAQRVPAGWLINGDIHAAMLVGAGGHFCPVARLLGPGGAKETVVAAQEIEFPLTPAQKADCLVAQETPELYFCPDLAGYAWCFRKGDYLNIGLGREDNAQISRHVADFSRWMKSTGRIPRDTPEQFHGHAYILYGHAARPLVDDAVLLIGDSAGLAYAQSGEGIRPAVESALIAAQTIASAAARYDRQNLDPYARNLTARLGPRQSNHGLSALLPAPVTQALAGLLLGTRWFSRQVVLDRWFLHRQTPALMDV